MTVQLIYVTCTNQDEAKRIAKYVVEQKLAACANIFQPHTSIFEWNGALCENQEIAMILKTTAENVEALKEAVLKRHSYDNPCFVVLDVASGAEPFLEWIATQTM